MTSAVITIGEAATLAEIAKTLERHRIKRVPVLREGKLVGIVSRGNLLQALASPEAGPPATVDDDTIREQLIAELRRQPWAHLSPEAIAVENGIVRLSGIVQTEDERRALRIAAENAAGVKGVDDHLTIWSPAPI
jgi:CBS domain-containing protein